MVFSASAPDVPDEQSMFVKQVGDAVNSQPLLTS
jgi:hypothetical protein